MSQPLKVAVSIALLVAFAAAVPWLGFFSATFVYLIAHMTFLGIRPWWKPLAVTAGVLGVLYVLFEYLLRVDLPGGVLI